MKTQFLLLLVLSLNISNLLAQIEGPQAVSEGDVITYEYSDYSPDMPIKSLTWEVVGGTILSSDNQHVTIEWGTLGVGEIKLSVSLTVFEIHYDYALNVNVLWFTFSGDDFYSPDYILEKAFDGDISTFCRNHPGDWLYANIDLNRTVQACKLSINASDVYIEIKVDGSIYDYTMYNNQTIYIVKPDGFNKIELKQAENGLGKVYDIYEIEIEEIPIETVSFAYDYDVAGNMNSRTLVLGSLKSAKFTATAEGEMLEESEVVEVDIEESKVKIYPNPTKGKLRVELVDINNSDIAEVSVFTIKGVEVYRGKGIVSEIDLEAQVSGVYILSIKINGAVQTWNIIKE